MLETLLSSKEQKQLRGGLGRAGNLKLTPLALVSGPSGRSRHPTQPPARAHKAASFQLRLWFIPSPSLLSLRWGECFPGPM